MLAPVPGTRHITAVVFWTGLALSLGLSLMLISALGAFGFQPAPIWARLLSAAFILMPAAALIARQLVGKTMRSDLMIGSATAIVVLGYVVLMNVLNP